jgi:hypothetical protein
MILGTGQFKYRVNAEWAKLPNGWSFKEVAAVGVDSQDRVYVFNRGEHPMMVFDRQGNFLRSWGEGQYPRAHGVHMAPDDTIFLTDDGSHFVRKVTLDGKVLLELGVPGKQAPFMSGEPFHRCTHRRCLRRARFMFQTATATPASTSTRRTEIADVVGRARHRPRRVQHRSQYLLRRRRLGLCRRPREPSSPGL